MSKLPALFAALLSAFVLGCAGEESPPAKQDPAGSSKQSPTASANVVKLELGRVP